MYDQFYKKPLKIQWHVTERCNLRCAHCYQDDLVKRDLPYKQLLQILEQFEAFAEKWLTKQGSSSKTHLVITGGEPFVRNDFKTLLTDISKNQENQ